MNLRQPQLLFPESQKDAYVPLPWLAQDSEYCSTGAVAVCLQSQERGLCSAAKEYAHLLVYFRKYSLFAELCGQ